MKLLQQLNIISESKPARRVPAGTFSDVKKKDSEQVTKFSPEQPFDPANPYHADEKKKRDAEEAKQPKYTPAELKKKAKEVAKQLVADYRKAKDVDELGPHDLIDFYVDQRQDPKLWAAVSDILMGTA